MHLYSYLSIYFAMQVLKQIPKSHRNVFKYLCAFIRELLLHNDENKLDAKTLGKETNSSLDFKKCLLCYK